MKFKITYEYDSMNAPHFFAVTEINGLKQFTGGNTWAHARMRHMQKLEGLSGKIDCPPPEEVDI